MKIGILTFHDANNLGAVLQAYALQLSLQKLGIDSDIIDYKCKQILNSKKVLLTGKSIKSYINFIQKKGYYIIRGFQFDKFRKAHLKLSSHSYTDVDIESINSAYDCLITGSDQVWNFSLTGDDMVYFLNFSTKNRYSYAASIGNFNYSQAELEVIIKELTKFNKISVREVSAKNLLLNYLNKDIVLCPDPVFLLEKEAWIEMMSKRQYHQKYILVYIIQKDVNVMKSAEEYSKRTGYRIISNRSDIEFMLHNSPQDFISWIYHAEAVFTNSFHGTAFSLILNKKLSTDIDFKFGRVNNRIKDLLDTLKSEQCIIDKNDSSPKLPCAEDGIIQLRNEGIGYIKSMLEDMKVELTKDESIRR